MVMIPFLYSQFSLSNYYILYLLKDCSNLECVKYNFYYFHYIINSTIKLNTICL